MANSNINTTILPRVLSMDAETNGLWGQAFAIGAILYSEDGSEAARFVGRCPIQGEKVNPWVAENVLPQMEAIPIDHTYLAGGGMSGHQKFAENTNRCIFATGLMVINSKRWRETHLLERALEAVKYYGDRLRMFDLDILNNVCQGTILPLSLRWCAFEDLVSATDVSDTALYPFLNEIYTREEIEGAVLEPAIIHYTGVNSVRVWNRPAPECPAVYLFYQRLEVVAA